MRCFFHGITVLCAQMLTGHDKRAEVKKVKKWLHYGKCAVCLAVTALLVLLIYGFVTVPDTVSRTQSEPAPRSIYTLTPMTVRSTESGSANTEYDALVKLFSSIPVKHTRLKISERQRVAVGGEIFGRERQSGRDPVDYDAGRRSV